MKLLIGFLSLVVAVHVASAQGKPPQLPDVPPPRAPWVKPVPEKASWAIVPQEQSMDKAEEPVRAKPRVARIESFRNGDLKRDLITYPSGQREEVWYTGGQALLSTDGGKVTVRSQADMDDTGLSEGVFRLLGNSFKSPGYPGFKWVDKANYNGVALFNKAIPAYHYILRGKEPVSGQEIVAAEAWVHAETGAPVAFVAEGALYVYQFGEAPADSVSLPSNFDAAHKRVKVMQDRRKRLEADAAALQ